MSDGFLAAAGSRKLPHAPRALQRAIRRFLPVTGASVSTLGRCSAARRSRPGCAGRATRRGAVRPRRGPVLGRAASGTAGARPTPVAGAARWPALPAALEARAWSRFRLPARRSAPCVSARSTSTRSCPFAGSARPSRRPRDGRDHRQARASRALSAGGSRLRRSRNPPLAASSIRRPAWCSPNSTCRPTTPLLVIQGQAFASGRSMMDVAKTIVEGRLALPSERRADRGGA